MRDRIKLTPAQEIEEPQFLAVEESVRICLRRKPSAPVVVQMNTRQIGLWIGSGRSLTNGLCRVVDMNDPNARSA